MSFNLGQFRKNMIPTSDYSIDLINYATVQEIDAAAELSSIGISDFKDKAIVLNGNGQLQTNVNYYLSFKVNRLLSYSQTFTVYLKNSNQTENNTQEVAVYTVNKGDPDDIITFEMIITPNAVYNQIVLELQRRVEDLYIIDKDGIYGRRMTVELLDYKQINNILDNIGIKPLIKIGIQGPTGLLMCINGEEIRVGKSGIYEILNDYDVNFIGFVIKSSSSNIDDEDYFILDYQY